MRSGVWAAVAGWAVAVALTAAQAGAATRYECSFDGDNRRGGNWVPPVVVIDDSGDKIIVFDPIIREFVGEPIPARRTDETRVRVTYGWQVETRVRQQSARMVYRLTYYRNGRPATMSALPAGYDNGFSGEGTCKVSTR